ncbi:unnamed protein product [Rhizoctonia solani]|uniref:DUF7587 domain-containing protein n=1 Tax=Rhizoctonia solani TaxID=456999 RepID=A0A8H3ABY0_9AGAM|nr:unnamed protein product [Rhizoctonia solani]
MPNLKAKLLSGIIDRKKAPKEELDFLMGQTRFLYRVYTEECRSPRVSQGFIAHKFRNDVHNINAARLLANDDTRYLSGLNHLESQENSPWISTTRLWDWAMWRLMSSHEKMKSACVAVIDLLHFPELQLQPGDTYQSDLSLERFHGQIIHALDVIKRVEVQSPLGKAPSSEVVKRARDRANAADEVLVYAIIPSSSVVSTFSLQDIRPSVPRQFATGLNADSDNQKMKRRRKAHKPKDEDYKEQVGRFRNTRYNWTREIDKEKWDTDKHGRKFAELAYAFLKQGEAQRLTRLDGMPQHDISLIQTNTGSLGVDPTRLDKTPQEVSGGVEVNDEHVGAADDHDSTSSGEGSTRLADVFGRAGIYEMDAEAGSMASLTSAYSRLTTASKVFSSQESLSGPIPESIEGPKNDQALLINLSMLPKAYHMSTKGLDPSKGIVEASEPTSPPSKDESISKKSEAQREINIFCDQLLILSSSILEPYWNTKQRKGKDWDILKHAIVESVKPKITRMEDATAHSGEEEVNPDVIYESFEKHYPPYQWVTSKPTSKGRKLFEKVTSKIG